MFMFFDIIDYLVSSLAILFIFKALDVEPWKAFIPIYNYYRVFYEYSGRVYKKKWYNIYLIFLVVSIVFVLLFQAYTFSYTVSNIDNSLQKLIINTSVLLIVSLIIDLIINVLLFYPILYKKTNKILFITNIAITIFINVLSIIFICIYTLEFIDVNNDMLYAKFVVKALSILNNFILVYIAYSFNKKVVDNNITIQDRLNIDKNSITYETIFEIEKRNKKLI